MKISKIFISRPAWLDTYGEQAGYLAQSQLALLQDAISSGEVTPRKLIISGLMYDSPLTIEGGAEAHSSLRPSSG